MFMFRPIRLQLLQQKHPTAWVQFETGVITEEELIKSFFLDDRPVDRHGLVEMMVDSYRYIEGMEPLLKTLSDAGYEVHACSNYPIWYKYIEEKLEISKYLDWTYISCEGHMKGFHKPSAQCFQTVLKHSGRPASQHIFIDDRNQNVHAAREAGLTGILFQGDASTLITDLREAGVDL